MINLVTSVPVVINGQWFRLRVILEEIDGRQHGELETQNERTDDYSLRLDAEGRRDSSSRGGDRGRHEAGEVQSGDASTSQQEGERIHKERVDERSNTDAMAMAWARITGSEDPSQTTKALRAGRERLRSAIENLARRQRR
jgi:hypothetical protein